MPGMGTERVPLSGRISRCPDRLCPLHAELREIGEDRCDGLLGVTCLADLNPSYLHHGAPVVSTPSALSVFPLLGPEDDGR